MAHNLNRKARRSQAAIIHINPKITTTTTNIIISSTTNNNTIIRIIRLLNTSRNRLEYDDLPISDYI